MKKLKNTLIACFLVVSPMAYGAENNTQTIEGIPQSLRSYWESIITSTKHPEAIVFDPSFPGAIEDCFRQESSNPDYQIIVSPGCEEQYTECLLQSMEKGHSRSPCEISWILRNNASSLLFFINNKKIQKTKDLNYETPQNILENSRDALKKLKETSPEDIYQRIKLLTQPRFESEAAEIYTDNPEELIAILSEKVEEQHKLAEELVKISAQRGYCLAQNIFAWKLKGEGNLSEAKDLFALAAAQNLDVAQFGLGSVLEQEGDIKGADEQYGLAAQKGNRSALVKVALSKEREGNFGEAKLIYALTYKHMYYQPALFPLGLILEKEGFYSEAETLYAAALVLDSCDPKFDSFIKLKEMKEQGRLNVTKNWFTLTSQDQGNEEYILGLASKDRNNAKDMKLAEEYFTQAAQKGHPAAMVALGSRKEHSCADLKDASDLYRQAHEKGYIPGTFHLAQLKERAISQNLAGENQQTYQNEAVLLFEIAREKGYPPERSQIDAILDKILTD